MPLQPASPDSAAQSCRLCGAAVPVLAAACPGCGEPCQAAPVGDPAITSAFLVKFRSELLALGVLWLLIGTLSCIATGLFLMPVLEQFRWDPLILGFMGINLLMGISLCGVGVGALLKQKWALPVGFFVSLAASVVSLGVLSLCGPIFGLLAVFQAARTWRWANQLEAAGLPLDIRPDELRERLAPESASDAPSDSA